MIRVKLFDGIQKDLVAYNGQALLNYAIEFYTEACDTDLYEDEESFTFPGFSSAYFRVYNERFDGRLIKSISNIALTGSSLVINTNDMLFNDLGVYYYEIGYIQAGGYDTVLMYGNLDVR